MRCITAITPTVCDLMGVTAPAISEREPLAEVLAAAVGAIGASRLDRVLAYLPDAIGTQLLERFPKPFETVYRHAPLGVPLHAVMPSVTPVCFASMWTGAQPEAHGIRKYEKPVLTCDTIYDALIRAGRKPVIIAVANCSMERIFRDRPMDYYAEPNDDAVMARAFEILEARKHDFVIVYQIGYDGTSHKTHPYSDEAIGQMHRKIENFAAVADKMNTCWKGLRRMISFNPDHGNHTNLADGRGTHGMDIPQDMDVHHFFGFRRD